MNTRWEPRNKLLASNAIRCVRETYRWDREARNCTAVAYTLTVKAASDVNFLFERQLRDKGFGALMGIRPGSASVSVPDSYNEKK